ncbi:hypothetical protein THAOC_03690 [Thalassiosira oceanica]|uniref:Uncharacterized protein n=1 Tax=Thalassiosira oceanica TaxID=159749 RepID=K0TPN7_THAOC|nr:hypothetical protein THAOC_03690 [Thalassiosira oceanica]|eukprot:EJK74622.1 hypothetical protein THAOC_03690 [Thalassiosira oceanica]
MRPWRPAWRSIGEVPPDGLGKLPIGKPSARGSRNGAAREGLSKRAMSEINLPRASVRKGRAVRITVRSSAKRGPRRNPDCLFKLQYLSIDEFGTRELLRCRAREEGDIDTRCDDLLEDGRDAAATRCSEDTRPAAATSETRRSSPRAGRKDTPRVAAATYYRGGGREEDFSELGATAGGRSRTSWLMTPSPGAGSSVRAG